MPIIGTSPESIDLAEDRKRFGKLLEELEIPQPAGGMATSVEEALAVANRDWLSGAGAAHLRAGRTRDGDCVRRRGRESQYMSEAVEYSQERPVLVDHFLENAVEVDVDALCDCEGRDHRRDHAAH